MASRLKLLRKPLKLIWRPSPQRYLFQNLATYRSTLIDGMSYRVEIPTPTSNGVPEFDLPIWILVRTHLVFIWYQLNHRPETRNRSERAYLKQDDTPNSEASQYPPTVDVTVKFKLYGLPDIEFKDIPNPVSLNDLHQRLCAASKGITELRSLLGSMQLTG